MPASIADFQDDTRRLARHSHIDAPTFQGIADGVVDEIAQHDAKRIRIAPDSGPLASHHAEIDALGFSKRELLLDQQSRERIQVHLFDWARRAVRLLTRERE